MNVVITWESARSSNHVGSLAKVRRERGRNLDRWSRWALSLSSCTQSKPLNFVKGTELLGDWWTTGPSCELAGGFE